MATGSAPSSNSPDGQRKSDTKPDVAPPKNYLAVARGSDLIVIRVVGAGNMLNASALADFAEEQRRSGFTKFVFDMERCKGLDSTFMGVMVGIYNLLYPDPATSGRLNAVTSKDEPARVEPVAMTAEEAAKALQELFNRKDKDEDESADAAPPEKKPATSLSAVNVTPEVKNVMAMLGVDAFVKVRGSCDLSQLEMTLLPEKNIPPTERRRLILRAHENLVEIDKRNLQQFGPFLQSLSAELAKE